MIKKICIMIVIILLNTMTVTASEVDTELIPIPIVFSSPETGLGFGGMGMYFKDTNTIKSKSLFGGFYTAERQTNLFASTEQIRNEQLYGLGLSYQDWVKKFYGVNNQIDFIKGQEYDSQGFKLEGEISRKITENSFLGVISNYESYDLNLSQQINQDIVGVNGVDLLGLGIKYRADNRDREMNTRQGQYLEYQSVAYNQDFTDYQFLMHQLDYRSFKLLKPDYVFAWQSKLELNIGKVPLQKLSSLGDMNILRGFESDKFIAENKFATQVEYRYPIYQKWSGTVFAGVGEVFKDFAVDKLKKSWGLGFRYNLDKKRGVNLRVDFAFNSDESSFYFNLGEAF